MQQLLFNIKTTLLKKLEEIAIRRRYLFLLTLTLANFLSKQHR